MKADVRENLEYMLDRFDKKDLKLMLEEMTKDEYSTGFEKRLHIYEIILTVVMLVGIVASIIGIFATNFRWEVIVATIAILFMDIVTLDSLWNDRNNVAHR